MPTFREVKGSGCAFAAECGAFHSLGQSDLRVSLSTVVKNMQAGAANLGLRLEVLNTSTDHEIENALKVAAHSLNRRAQVDRANFAARPLLAGTHISFQGKTDIACTSLLALALNVILR